MLNELFTDNTAALALAYHADASVLLAAEHNSIDYTYPHRVLSQQDNIANVVTAFAELDCFQFRNARAICHSARTAVGFEKMKPILTKLRSVDRQLSREVLRLFEDSNYHADTNRLLVQLCQESTVPEAPPTILFGTELPPESRILRFDDDMPESVLSGRLGEICQKRMLKNFPIAYSWPAIVAAAGVMVPPVPPNPDVVMAVDQMTTSLTALVGPVHSGKSQAILWAINSLGMSREYYSDVRAGSSESLLRKLMGMKKKGTLLRSLMIDLDEWAHLFAKASIEGSSFASFLQTAFYKNRVNVLLGGGFEVDLTCALSFVGGIVEEDFGTIFGAKSLGGLHDRFTFAMCPKGYNFMYQPWEGKPEVTDPVMVTVDGDVREMVNALRRETGAGREAEIAVRVAQTCASFDGRQILKARDCEHTVRAFTLEQLRLRQFLRPNAGVNPIAIISNAALGYIKSKMDQGSGHYPVPMRTLINSALRRMAAQYGIATVHQAVAQQIQFGRLRFTDSNKTHVEFTPEILGKA